ncbi:hypothetical protein ALI144C_22930 [Actinosynnema sp. ALI-1.44]|nr:hypothetical protein ALI144C_22930 [Actinosynnema sp. ALI-1.44]
MLVADHTGVEMIHEALTYQPMSVVTWDLATRQQVSEFNAGTHGSPRFSKDGTRVAIASHGRAEVWDLRDPRRVAQVETVNESRFAAFGDLNPDGTLLASVDRDGKLSLWDVAARTRWAVLTGHGQAVQQLAWSADGASLASASTDGTIALWTVDIGRAVNQLCHSLNLHRPRRTTTETGPVSVTGEVFPRTHPTHPLERGTQGETAAVPDFPRHRADRGRGLPQQVGGEREAPVGQERHRRLTHQLREPPGQCGPRDAGRVRQ